MKDGIVVECRCESWQKHSEDIFRAQVFYSQRTGSTWLGGLWSFCPWCGSKLEQIKHDAVVVKPDLMTSITQWSDSK